MPVRLLVISGSHPRHSFAVEPLLHLGLELLNIQIEREGMIPEPPKGLSHNDAQNFERHFKEREQAEELYFGRQQIRESNGLRRLRIAEQELNSNRIASEVAQFKPDIAVVFGSGLIRNPLLELLPEHTINLHLGLSPDYKGSATLFWPFYMLEPQFAGFTIHKVVKKIDAGEIYIQGTPELIRTDGIHDVACKTVVAAQLEIMRLVSHLAEGGEVVTETQKRTGKLWLNSDFQAAHLRVIYDIFENEMVKAYLNNELGDRKPRLYAGF